MHLILHCKRSHEKKKKVFQTRWVHYTDTVLNAESYCRHLSGRSLINGDSTCSSWAWREKVTLELTLQWQILQISQSSLWSHNQTPTGGCCSSHQTPRSIALGNTSPCCSSIQLFNFIFCSTEGEKKKPNTPTFFCSSSGYSCWYSASLKLASTDNWIF